MPVSRQQVRGAKAGELQQVRRTVGAAGDDHLAAHARGLQPLRRAVLDTDGTTVLDQHARGMRLGDDGQVLPVARRSQIRGSGAPAAFVVGRRLVVAGALLGGAVEVGGARNAGLHGGLHHRLRQRPDLRRVRHTQRPADAVEFVRAALIVLGSLEVGQYRIPVPAFASALAPVVIVRGIAAHIHHAVDRTGAAKHLAARQIQRPAVQFLLGRAVEHPVDARVGKCLGVADRDVDPRAAVLDAGFQQQHAIAPGFRQPRRHDTAGRTRAGDDVVVGCVLAHAVAASCTPSSAAMRSRMMNFCILPVTVIGNSSTNRI